MLNQFVWGLQPELARSISLHYPKSIPQTVSLVETTELPVKSSRRPMGKNISGGNQSRGPNQSNWGRDNGEVIQVVVEDIVVVVEVDME